MGTRKKCLIFEGEDEITGVMEGGVTLEMFKMKIAGCLSGRGEVRWGRNQPRPRLGRMKEKHGGECPRSLPWLEAGWVILLRQNNKLKPGASQANGDVVLPA